MTETQGHVHDPVGAIAEADAIGRTAEIFADIRAVMGVPMVTAIWRGLEGIEGGLETVWTAVRPVIASGESDQVMFALEQNVVFPTPPIASAKELAACGFVAAARSDVLSIIRAYNRANALSLIVLTALARVPGKPLKFDNAPPPSPSCAALKPLLEKEEISSENWKILERTTFVGAELRNHAVPTLWRHLVYWPELIDLATQRFLPLNEDGSMFQAVDDVMEFVERAAPSLGLGIDRTVAISDSSIDMVEGYIGRQPSVCRMTTVGRSLERWLIAEP